MGEKIADIAFISIKGFDLVVELNEAASGNGQHEIHVQGTGLRIDLNPTELVLVGAAILNAAEKLRKIKNIPATGLTNEPLN